MKTTIYAALAAGILALAGCSNTAEGMKEDANNAGRETAQTVENTREAAGEAAENAAASTLTPRIKTAIVADTLLNDDKNRIDVDSREGVVTLRGHVATQDLKDHAEKVARKIMDEADAKETLRNELVVGSGTDISGTGSNDDHGTDRGASPETSTTGGSTR